MDQPEAWLTLKESAEQIGCSVITLRRMIKRNTVQAKQVDTPNGRSWRVLSSTLISLPRVHVAQTDHSLVEHGDQGLTTLELVRLVAQLQADKAELAHQVGFLQAELQQRDKTIRALQAPREEPDDITAIVPGSDPVGQVEPAQDPPPRRWWQRILFG